MSVRFASRLFGFCLIGSLTLSFACSSDDDMSAANEPDAGPTRGSLCTPERAPCDDGSDRLDLRAALRLARAQVPNGQLTQVVSSGAGTLNVDGLDNYWTFVFVDDAVHRSQLVHVYAGQAFEPHDDNADQRCDDGEEMQPLDSREVAHDTVLRVEARLGMPFRGKLFLVQFGCTPRPEHHVVAELPDGSTWYFARYLDDGRFLELVGPCAGIDLAPCLRGE